jgi:cytochrome c-type biogenesis protein CcmH/NrfG
MGLLVAQGTSPLRLAVGVVVAFFVAVVSVTSRGSYRRQGGEPRAAEHLRVADSQDDVASGDSAPFLSREYRCT